MLLDMRQSATLGHFQDRAPCMESLEAVDLWNLCHRRLRLPNALYIIKWTKKTIWLAYWWNYKECKKLSNEGS